MTIDRNGRVEIPERIVLTRSRILELNRVSRQVHGDEETRSIRQVGTRVWRLNTERP